MCIRDSFCVGLTSSVLVGFFSSEGGLISDMTDISIKFLLDSKSRNSSHFTKFHINTPIIIWILYTLVSVSYTHLLKQSVDIELNEEDIVNIEQILNNINEIVYKTIPPKLEKKRICKSCAYYDLCFI